MVKMSGYKEAATQYHNATTRLRYQIPTKKFQCII